MALLFTFVYYGWYSSSYPGGTDDGWVFSTGMGMGSSVATERAVFGRGFMVTAGLVPAGQLDRGDDHHSPVRRRCGPGPPQGAGVRVGGGIIRGFGIAAVVATVAYIIAGLASGDYRWIAVTDLAALAGAILIIIGGGLLGPAAGPASTPGAPLPARGPGGTY